MCDGNSSPLHARHNIWISLTGLLISRGSHADRRKIKLATGRGDCELRYNTSPRVVTLRKAFAGYFMDLRAAQRRLGLGGRGGAPLDSLSWKLLRLGRYPLPIQSDPHMPRPSELLSSENHAAWPILGSGDWPASSSSRTTGT